MIKVHQPSYGNGVRHSGVCRGYCIGLPSAKATIHPPWRSRHRPSHDIVPRSSAKQTRLDDGTGVGGDTGPQVGTLLGDGSGDGGSLHLSLGVDNDTATRARQAMLNTTE